VAILTLIQFDPALNFCTPCLSVKIPEQGERHDKEKLY